MSRKIIFFVLLAHCGVLLALAIHHWSSPAHGNYRPIAVRTVHQPVVIQSSMVAHKEKQAPIPKKKTPAKKTQKAKPVPPAPVKFFDAKVPKLIEEPVATLSAVVEAHSSSYGDLLVETLQQALQLPELGEVRARLTLSPKGEVVLVEILDAKSVKNAEWLKVQLPLLSLPEFRDFGILEAVLDFTITFRNVERS